MLGGTRLGGSDAWGLGGMEAWMLGGRDASGLLWDALRVLWGAFGVLKVMCRSLSAQVRFQRLPLRSDMAPNRI